MKSKMKWYVKVKGVEGGCRFYKRTKKECKELIEELLEEDKELGGDVLEYETCKNIA